MYRPLWWISRLPLTFACNMIRKTRCSSRSCPCLLSWRKRQCCIEWHPQPPDFFAPRERKIGRWNVRKTRVSPESRQEGQNLRSTVASYGHDDCVDYCEWKIHTNEKIGYR